MNPSPRAFNRASSRSARTRISSPSRKESSPKSSNPVRSTAAAISSPGDATLHLPDISRQYTVTIMGESSIANRRTYDNRARQEKAAQTRERIVAAGSELVHAFDTWNWRDLTFKAVAERAGVGERTVYRHFPTERHLHDAVMVAPGVRGGRLLRGRRPDQHRRGDRPRVRVTATVLGAQNRRDAAGPDVRRRRRAQARRAHARRVGVGPRVVGCATAGRGGPSRRAVERAQLRTAGRGVGHRRPAKQPMRSAG